MWLFLILSFTLLMFLVMLLIKFNLFACFALAGFLITTPWLLLRNYKLKKNYDSFVVSVADYLRQADNSQENTVLMDEKALLEKLSKLLSSLGAIKNQLATQQEIAENYSSKLKNIEHMLSCLCSVHLPLDIDPQWDEILEKEWSVISSETLESLNTIKIMNEQNQEFIQQVIKEFGIQHENFSNFSETYSKNIIDYAQKASIIKASFFDDIENSSNRIEETFGKFGKVLEITERIKMISLNMSIEASKVRGSEAFYILARELRKLAADTEETLSGITMIIQTTIESMKISKDKQTKEFLVMESMIQQFGTTLDEYKATSTKLAHFIQQAINQIDSNQVSQRSILLNFFKNLQRIAIVKEEFEHRIKFNFILLTKTNEVIEQLVRKDQVCKGIHCEHRRNLLNELASIANTDEERKFVNKLFKTLLNEDREVVHGDIGDEGFIKF